MANPEAVANSNVFDCVKATKRLGGQTELLQKLAVLFLRDTPDQLEKIGKGIDLKDGEMSFVAAHTLQGASSVFCTAKFESHCAEIANSIKAHDWSLAKTLASQANQEYASFQKQLKTFIGSQED